MNNEIMWSKNRVFLGESEEFLCIVTSYEDLDTFILIFYTKGASQRLVVVENMTVKELIDKVKELSDEYIKKV